MKRTILALFCIAFTGFAAPRGVENNNPGNLVVGDKWLGRSGTDGRFLKFKSPEYGIRALIIVLRTYDKKYNSNTIDGIIRRWAPPHENNTSKYISYVSKKTGISSTKKLRLFQEDKIKDVATLKKVVCAIIAYENGNYSYSPTIIDGAIKMIGVYDNSH